MLVSAEVWWWAHAAYSGNLSDIRVQEAYAWVSVSLLVMALLIGPLCKLIPQLPVKGLYFDARRLLGIGAAWFASLHVIIAYKAQFNFANPFLLPNNFKVAFVLGISALLILLAMAFTSFDKAMKAMGIWWFRLHRFVYAAALLAMLHAFMVGVHATSIVPLAIITGIALVLVVLHICIALWYPGRTKLWRGLTIVITLVLLGAITNYGFQQYVNNSGGVLSGLQGTGGHNH